MTWEEKITLTCACILLAFVLAIVAGIIFGAPFRKARYESEVIQCMRAFEYSRDQCDFILQHRVMPGGK